MVLCDSCHMQAERAAVRTYQNRRKHESSKRQKRRLVPYGMYQ